MQGRLGQLSHLEESKPWPLLQEQHKLGTLQAMPHVRLQQDQEGHLLQDKMQMLTPETPLLPESTIIKLQISLRVQQEQAETQFYSNENKFTSYITIENQN